MNGKIIALGFGLLALGVLATAPTWAQAKKAGAPVIGIVDTQAIMQNSQAAKGVRTQIDKVRNSYQQSIHGKEEELRKLDHDLAQQRSILSAEAFQQRQRDFQQKVAAAQKDVQERSRKLEAAFGAAMEKVNEAFIQVVDQVAKEQSLTLVLPKQAVVYAVGEMDITPEVLKRLNSKLPSVAVAVPK